MPQRSYLNSRNDKNTAIFKRISSLTPFHYWQLNEGISATVAKDYGTAGVDLTYQDDLALEFNGIKFRTGERTANTLTPNIASTTWSNLLSSWNTTTSNLTVAFWIVDTVPANFGKFIDMFRTRDATPNWVGTFAVEWRTTGLSFHYNRDGNVDTYLTSGNFPNSMSLSTSIPNNPLHIAITFSATGIGNGTVRWYLNGINYSTTSSVNGPISILSYNGANNWTFPLGQRAVATHPNAANKFVSMAHVGIWKRVLDAGEIWSIYNAGI
jgi:hypothetical protein